jgi:hypothetical protein
VAKYKWNPGAVSTETYAKRVQQRSGHSGITLRRDGKPGAQNSPRKIPLTYPVSFLILTSSANTFRQCGKSGARVSDPACLPGRDLRIDLLKKAVADNAATR